MKQYVEKAFVQDSVQLFFAVIAGVTGLFGIWTSTFYGWGVLLYNKICNKIGLCKKNGKGSIMPSAVDGKCHPEVRKFQQEEFEKLKCQVEHQVEELEKFKRQVEELTNLLKN